MIGHPKSIESTVLDPQPLPDKSDCERRVLIKRHEIDERRCVAHVLAPDGSVLESVSSVNPAHLFDFAASVYPGAVVLATVKRTA